MNKRRTEKTWLASRLAGANVFCKRQSSAAVTVSDHHHHQCAMTNNSSSDTSGGGGRSSSDHTISVKNISRSKRFQLKRTDSGLSSDSSEPGPSISGTEEKINTKISDMVVVPNNDGDDDDDQDVEKKDTRKDDDDDDNAGTDQFLSEFVRHRTSSPQLFSEIYTGFGTSECTSYEQQHRQRSFEDSSYHSDETYQYEMKLANLIRQKELISRKLLYMEEHIIDLNQENDQLKKQLINFEELYKKKIQIREDEIESLKETIMELEKNNAETRCREQELSVQKRLHLEDIKLLKQQITSQEQELQQLKITCEKLSELEILYRKTNEQLEGLKNSNITALKELEENFKLRCIEKDTEIVKLRTQIDELNQKLLMENQKKSLLLNTKNQSVVIDDDDVDDVVVDHLFNDNNNNNNNSDNKSPEEIVCTNVCTETSGTDIGTSVNGSPKRNRRFFKICRSKSVVENPFSAFLYHRQNNDDPTTTSNGFVEQTTTTTEQRINGDETLKKESSTTDMNKMGGKKWPLKRISSCDIDEDVLRSINDRQNHRQNGNGIDKNNNLIDRTLAEPIVQNETFPSLPDVMLRKLCLLNENTCSIESLSEQEIDAKFHALSLAFKTDKFTLKQRVKLYRHQRDVAENDARTELSNLQEYIQELYRILFGCDSKFFYNTNLSQLKELKEMLDKIQMQVQVIQASVMKISSRSELYGAVKQEEKLSIAFDVILLHTENLKRAKERDAKELEDMKRLLANSGARNDLDCNDFDYMSPAHHRRLSRSSKKDRSSLLNPLMMANSLQAVQVSYHQTSQSPSQNYRRTRRLSVPAAEIRNRPRLLQLLSETSRQLAEENEKNSHSDDADTDSSSRDEIQTEEQHDDSNMFHLDEPRSGKKLSITPVNTTEDQNDDGESMTVAQQPGPDSQNDSSQQSSCPSDPVNSCTNNNNNTTIITSEGQNKFHKELLERLAPYEERTWTKELLDQLQNGIHDSTEQFLKTLRNNQWLSSLMNIRYQYRNRHTSGNTIRYGISTGLILISILIILWSVIIPMFNTK